VELVHHSKCLGQQVHIVVLLALVLKDHHQELNMFVGCLLSQWLHSPIFVIILMKTIRFISEYEEHRQGTLSSHGAEKVLKFHLLYRLLEVDGVVEGMNVFVPVMKELTEKDKLMNILHYIFFAQY
jgi:hypothetical protein